MLRFFDVFGKFMWACGLALALLIPPGSAHAGSFKVLHSFQGGSDGSSPLGGLKTDEAGNLIGTTEFGRGSGNEPSNSPGKHCGKSCGGTLFSLSMGGTNSVLYSFCSKAKCKDGSTPTGNVVADKATNIFGASTYGGANASGTVFKVATDGSESVLHSFCTQPNCADGELPAAGLSADSAGNLYGTTTFGGANCTDQGGLGCGTIFKLTPDGSYSVLYSFCVGGEPCTDGDQPHSGVSLDSAGNVYGVADVGGVSPDCPFIDGCGIIFKLVPDGTFTVLYTFCSQPDCTDGLDPESNLTVDSAGNLYGTTAYGGTGAYINCEQGGCGVVFKLAPDGTFTVLHNFCSQTNCTDGFGPSSVIEDTAGNLFGAAGYGGKQGDCFSDGANNGCGVVYKLAPDGTDTVLHYFCTRKHCSDGASPGGDLLLEDNYIFGSTPQGGTNKCRLSHFIQVGCGTVFMLKK